MPLMSCTVGQPFVTTASHPLSDHFARMSNGSVPQSLNYKRGELAGLKSRGKTVGYSKVATSAVDQDGRSGFNMRSHAV